MQFEFTSLHNGWQNIINFHNSDHELYTLCGSPCSLQVYPDAASSIPFVANTMYDLVFNHNTAGDFNAYLDGVLALHRDGISDPEPGRTVFSDTDNIIRFFYDEFGNSENSPGVVKTINIYDQAYDPNNLPTPTHGVPEPSTLVLTGLALLALSRKSHRRN
jgi:hypothetical protein